MVLSSCETLNIIHAIDDMFGSVQVQQFDVMSTTGFTSSS